MKVSLARARAHWHLRSGLAEPLSGELDDVVARTGWVRTLAGADVYLALRARAPGIGRRAVDTLVEESRLRVIPAVRGCIYLVPSVHVPLALRIAAEAWRKGAERDLAKVGAAWTEIEEVGRAVATELTKAPATTDGVRKALPDGTVRSFGEKGKKVGVSSPLPIALRDLEFRGMIERTLEDGKLDTDRYVWRMASPDTGWSAIQVPDDALDRWAALARIFVGCAGPATIGDFATWAGLGKSDAKAAIERARLAKVEVEEYATEAWALEEDVVAMSKPAPVSARVALLSFEDNYLVAHGGPRWVVDPAEWSRPVQSWGMSKATTLGEAPHVATRTLTIGDQVAGVWEMDPDAGKILWATFAPVGRAAKAEIDRLASETAAFLEEELGHAHSFSLDTDDTMRERAAAVKALTAPVKKKAASKPKVAAKTTKKVAKAAKAAKKKR